MIRHSGATGRNPRVVDWSKKPKYAKGDNLVFFADALKKLDARVAIGLLGQRDLPGFTLRSAQAVLRWDLRPSLWSHVFMLVAPQGSLDGARLREVTLYSRAGTFPDPANNAVTEGQLALYRRPALDANVALLAVDMSEDEAKDVVHRALEDPNLDRLRFTLWEMLGVWESYLWTSGSRTNPLLEGLPIFSSAFAEYCFDGIRVDLTPGASERNSAPEHIWNGAVWWDEALASFGHRISGYYVLRDPNCSLLGPDELEDELQQLVPA
jgi:hypothetical protein